jgi:hypothetical protein
MHEANALYKLLFVARSLLVSTQQKGQAMKMWAQMKCSLTGLPGYLYFFPLGTTAPVGLGLPP